MAYILRFKWTRPDTSNPFFYELQDTDISFLEQLKNSQLLNHSREFSPDGLSYTATYTFESKQAKNLFKITLLSQYPGFLTKRNNYCLSVGHELVVEEEDTDLGIAGNVLESVNPTGPVIDEL